MNVLIKRNGPGSRHRLVLPAISSSNKCETVRILQYHKQSAAGRNFSGKITVRGRGAGNFRNLKLVDFRRLIWNVPGIVRGFIYDPKRSAQLALISYNNGLICYQLAMEGMKKGDIIECKMPYLSGAENSLIDNNINNNNNNINNTHNVGSTYPLISIPTGIWISVIESQPGKGGILCRSAGAFATIIKKDFKLGLAILLMRSGIYKGVPLNGLATIGQVSNVEHKNQVLGKAGVSRWNGIRPTVRGVAKKSR